jgi:hypothetical protein
MESSWPASYRDKSGHLVFTKEKAMFIEEKGFISKTADLILDMPYEKISKINTENDKILSITEEDGDKYRIETPYLTKAKNEIEDLLKQANK